MRATDHHWRGSLLWAATGILTLLAASCASGTSEDGSTGGTNSGGTSTGGTNTGGTSTGGTSTGGTSTGGTSSGGTSSGGTSSGGTSSGGTSSGGTSTGGTSGGPTLTGGTIGGGGQPAYQSLEVQSLSSLTFRSCSGQFVGNRIRIQPSNLAAVKPEAELTQLVPLWDDEDVAVLATASVTDYLDREATVLLEYYDSNGNRLGEFFSSPAVQYDTDQQLVGYDRPPSGTTRARVTLAMHAQPQSWVTKTPVVMYDPKVELWRAPVVTITSNPTWGLADPAGSIDVSVRVQRVRNTEEVKLEATLEDVDGNVVATWIRSGAPYNYSTSFSGLAPGPHTMRWSIVGAASGAVQRQGTRSFLVVAPDPTKVNPHFGIVGELGFRLGAGELPTMANALRLVFGDAAPVREFTSVSEMQGTNPDQRFLQSTREMVNVGLEPVALLGSVPQSLSLAPSAPNYYATPPSSYLAYGLQVERAADNLARQGTTAFEPWNETDGNVKFFPGRMSEAVQIQRVIYVATKRSDPSRIVAGNSLTGMTPNHPGQQLQMENEGPLYADRFIFHYYRLPQDLPGVAATFRQMQNSVRGTDLPVWFTETGSLWKEATEVDEAARFAQQFIAGRSQRVQRMMGYHLIEEHQTGRYEVGFFRRLPDGTFEPRRSLGAMVTLSKLLGEATPLGRDLRDQPSGIEIHWFSTSLGPVAATWTHDDQLGAPVATNFPARLRQGTLYTSLFGSTSANAPGFLDNRVVYVVGLQPPQFAAQSATLPAPPVPARPRVRSLSDVNKLAFISTMRLTNTTSPAQMFTAARHNPLAAGTGDTIDCAVELVNLSTYSAPAVVDSIDLELPSGLRIRGGLPNPQQTPIEIAADSAYPFTIKIDVTDSSGVNPNTSRIKLIVTAHVKGGAPFQVSPSIEAVFDRFGK